MTSAHNQTNNGSTVLSHVYGPIGHIELNRPAKLNALTLQMLTELTRVLKVWAEDPSIQLVLLTGCGERGFCAGGDIADFHQAITTGKHQDFINLLSLEFDLDYLISTYPKPLITLAHGITMGGGVGLASHAPIRLVTASAKLGMPEAKIGYTPDVGGSHLLANSPGHLGEYFAMSATSFAGADAVFMGFADVVVTDSFAENILDELDEFLGLSAAEIISAIEVLHGAPESHGVEQIQGWVDHAFSADTPQEVISRLEQMVHPAADQAAQLLKANSPSSICAAFHSVREARVEQDLRSALDRELRLARFLMYRPDLAEGIRAQVIDKDRNPHWSPTLVGEVDQDELRSLVRDSQL
ncbi:enoyl-CoA hydratase/isomerase family protein [Glutamicibacter sp. M10]|uniref:enoyl-CoA hydratase/isomerase family protein n=1 Tax=Glutamicibacter sp. M10 TaxID=3023076 RepID=UPI0021C62439|nr:enoyl-CoA hydratase/isomerase family protein [Glutamicibacter sp. M10]UXN33027.1 enoyl-CoA hydratase/isomerase family protein [Glutamicibacter sp. M10]